MEQRQEQKSVLDILGTKLVKGLDGGKTPTYIEQGGKSEFKRNPELRRTLQLRQNEEQELVFVIQSITYAEIKHIHVTFLVILE